MNARQYLALVGSIFVIGTVASCLQSYEQTPAHTRPLERRLQHQYQEQAQEYARKVDALPVAAWTIYRTDNQDIAADGNDASGKDVVTLVFDYDSGQLVSLLCLKWPNKPLKEFVGKPANAIALAWLRRLGLSREAQWRRVLNGTFGQTREMSCWQDGSRQVLLSVNRKTGHLVALRVHQNSAQKK